MYIFLFLLGLLTACEFNDNYSVISTDHEHYDVQLRAISDKWTLNLSPNTFNTQVGTIEISIFPDNQKGNIFTFKTSKIKDWGNGIYTLNVVSKEQINVHLEAEFLLEKDGMNYHITGQGSLYHSGDEWIVLKKIDHTLK